MSVNCSTNGAAPKPNAPARNCWPPPCSARCCRRRCSRRQWLEAAAHYHAATDDVGGDFYDLFPLSKDTWGFFLGDVAGKGASAAVVTSLTRYTLRTAAVINEDPVAVLHTLNSVLFQTSRR